MEFRQETFLQFVKKIKLPFVYNWPTNIFFIVVFASLVISNVKSNLQAAFVGGTVIALMFFTYKFFIYNSLYTIYSVGGQVVRNLANSKFVVLKDIKVHIKGFNILDKKKFFPPSYKRTIYDFDNSDIIFVDASLILLGKVIFYGGELFAYPVEITNSYSLTKLTKVKLNKWNAFDGNVQIEILDPNYKTAITIIMKNDLEKFIEWLTINYPMLNKL